MKFKPSIVSLCAPGVAAAVFISFFALASPNRRTNAETASPENAPHSPVLQEVWEQEEANLKKQRNQRETEQEKPDAVSEASKRWTPPPQGYTYQIVLIPEIDGYVVLYSENLYRGRGLSPDAARQLKLYGIKTVITLDPSPELEKTVKETGLIYLPLTTGPGGFSADLITRHPGVVRKYPGPYYLHSSEVNQNAGLLAAAHRIVVDKWSYEKTIIEYARLGGSLKDDDRLLRALEQLKPL